MYSLCNKCHIVYFRMGFEPKAGCGEKQLVNHEITFLFFNGSVQDSINTCIVNLEQCDCVSYMWDHSPWYILRKGYCFHYKQNFFSHEVGKFTYLV